LTEFGHAVVQHYRAVENTAEKAGANIEALSPELIEPATTGETTGMNCAGWR
jgi:hypothetical protein